MSAYLLHDGATVFCQHCGQAQATMPYSRVKVAGQAVTLQTDPWTVSGCPYMVGTAPVPCVTAQWTSGATRVKAGGAPVLLQDSQAVCTPNGTGVTIAQTQTRVKGT